MATTLSQRARRTGGSRTTPKGTRPPQRRNRAHRRQWLAYVATCPVLHRQTRAWLMLLARRSDDYGKPVWGHQHRQAVELGCSERMVRHYRAEAEAAGVISTDRADPERDDSGIWFRRRTNVYALTFPTTARRAANTAVGRPRPWSHLPATGCRSEPDVREPPPASEAGLAAAPAEIAAPPPPNDRLAQRDSAAFTRQRPPVQNQMPAEASWRVEARTNDELRAAGPGLVAARAALAAARKANSSRLRRPGTETGAGPPPPPPGGADSRP